MLIFCCHSLLAVLKLTPFQTLLPVCLEASQNTHCADVISTLLILAVPLTWCDLVQYMKHHGVEYEILPLPTCEPNKSFNLIFKVAERLEAFKLNR